MKFQKEIYSLFFFIGCLVVNAQKKEKDIDTEVVNVVKNYTPTIYDATKEKEVPTLDDEETRKREDIKYTIFSASVASTFKPSKGRASEVEPPKKETLFDNYFKLGFGTYTTANAELYVAKNIDENQYIGAMVRHLSSQGKIKGIDLDNKFSDTSVDFGYGNNQENYNFRMNLGYQNQLYNWYGLPEEFKGLLATNVIPQIPSIDPSHMYNRISVEGKINFKESIFNGVSTQFTRFWDTKSSTENTFNFSPVAKISIGDHLFKTKFELNYQDTKFKKYYFADFAPNYNAPFENQNSYFSVGINPNYQIQKENLTFNAGIDLVYLSTIKKVANGTDFGSSNKIYIYPKLTASLKVVENIMTAFAGAEGGLKQNSYRKFVDENPFLSPTLSIVPTDNQYEIYIGLRGKLTNYLGYTVQGSYNNEKNKALFKTNNYAINLALRDYEYGNSMGVVYDNITTYSFFGALNANVSKVVSLSVDAIFAKYTNSFEDEPWNLPAIKMGVNCDVTITKKWLAGTRLFYVGERKDQQIIRDASLNSINEATKIKTLDSFFDANFDLKYQHNNRWSGFLRANNIANQAYQRWLNFPVQSFQIILGANCKFDF
jgi:hypothetical protein